MMDEIFDRQYQAGRTELNAGIDRLLTRLGREIAVTLKAIHAAEFNAPWRSESKDQGCA